MEYLNCGIDMPVIGFGTFMLTGENCRRAVRTAIETGYRMIDTAEAYGNEAAVGEGIKDSGISREELFLVTKINFKSYEAPGAAIENSLKALKTDYIDLMLLHWPFGNYYAAWRELERAYSDGTIRAIGVSNFEPAQLLDIAAYNSVSPAADQIETNLYCQRNMEHSWLDKCSAAHMAYAPLGQGNRCEMFTEPQVLSIGAKYNKTPAQVMLRFLIQKNMAIIPRSGSSLHIKENFEIFDFALTDSEMSSLECLDKKEPLIGRPNSPELVEASLKW